MYKYGQSIERWVTFAVSGITSIAAIVVAVIAIHHEFSAPAVARTLSERGSSYVPKWEGLARAGRRFGNPRAPVTLIEFTDFECPFCRQFNKTIHTVMSRYPNDVGYVLIHRPLSIHRFAGPAARASECAGTTGRFMEAVDVLFEKQDSLGLKPWTSFAVDAGITDTTAFARCVTNVSDSAVMRPIDAGVRAANEMDVHGTPTVILNGWRYGQPPSDTELVRAIGDLLGGRPPYRGYPIGR